MSAELRSPPASGLSGHRGFRNHNLPASPKNIFAGIFTNLRARQYLCHAHGRVRDYDHLGRLLGLTGGRTRSSPKGNFSRVCVTAWSMISMNAVLASLPVAITLSTSLRLGGLAQADNF
jgi:hypothetical protein